MNKVDTTLSILNEDFSTTEEFIKRQDQCIDQLVALDDNGVNSIILKAKMLLEEMDPDDDSDDEYHFIILTLALVSRGDKMSAFLLLVQALYLPQAEDKSRYAKTLGEIDILGTIPVFIDILPKLESFD